MVVCYLLTSLGIFKNFIYKTILALNLGQDISRI